MNYTLQNSKQFINWLMHSLQLTIIFTVLLYSPAIFATSSCGNLFADALQTNAPAPDGTITFNCDSRIISNPDNVLSTVNINNPGGNCSPTCTGNHCQASGTPAPSLDVGNFQYNENGQSIILGNKETRTLGTDGVTDYGQIDTRQGVTVSFVSQPHSTVYRIQRLDIGQGNTVNFATGDYWIEDLRVGQGGAINVSSTGTVRLLLLNSATIDQGGLNNSSLPEASKHLFVYSFSDLTINQGNTFKGFIYARGNVLIRQGNIAAGAINAKNITFDQGANITYDAAAAGDLDVNDVCDFPPTLSHFIIQHDGHGNYCIPEPITVKAYNGTTLITNFNGTVKLNTKTGKGTWSILSGHGSLTDSTPDDGLAYYTFSPEDNGQATFELLYTSGAASMDIDVQLRYNGNVKDDDSEGLLNFTPNGFLLTSAPIPTPTPDIHAITRYSTTQVAGIADTIYLTAFGIKADQSCGKVDTYSGVKAIKFWQSYINPTSGTLTTTVNDTNVGASSATPVPVNLEFIDGTTSFSTLYRDVGMIQLSAIDDSSTDPNQWITGNTDNYVVKPAKLVITNIPGNPAAANASDNVFVKAGDNFTVDVTVQDNDGNATPNYGYELIPARIKLYSNTLVAPAGGINCSLNNGTIGNNTSFTRIAPGVFRGTEFYFDEVGIIRLKAMVADGNYLGVGNIDGPESINVGRFIPHHFAASINVPIFNTACPSGSFTYIGQPITYNVHPVVSVTAQSKLNNITQNYRNEFWKMTVNDIIVGYNSNSTIATLDSSNTVNAITVTQTNNGTGDITLGDGGGIQFNKIASTNIPAFNAEIQANVTIKDADEAAYLNNPYAIGNTQPNTGIAFSNSNSMLQGRISIGNNFGSELLPLALPVKMQYYNGTDYVTNTSDNCTSITNPSYIQLTPSTTGLITTPTLGTFSNGVGQINLSAPNQDGYVDATIDLSATGANLPYLQHDWPQNGIGEGFNDNPVGRGTFGIYHGNDKTIYTKEVLE